MKGAMSHNPDPHARGELSEAFNDQVRRLLRLTERQIAELEGKKTWDAGDVRRLERIGKALASLVRTSSSRIPSPLDRAQGTGFDFDLAAELLERKKPGPKR